MTLGSLTIQSPNELSVNYAWNGYEHETADGDIVKFVKNYRKIYSLVLDGLTDTDIGNIRDEIDGGEIAFVLSDYSIDTDVLPKISEESVPYGGSEYRRVVNLTLDDQTVYTLGNTLPTTGLSSGIRINEVYHPEPHDIKILNDIQNVDMTGQDGKSTRDYMHNRLRMKVDWKDILNSDLSDIVDNVLNRVYPNVTHTLFDDTSIIDITRQSYKNTGVGDLSLVITSTGSEINR